MTKNYPKGLDTMLIPDCDCEIIEGEKIEEKLLAIKRIEYLRNCGIGKKFMSKNFKNFDEKKNPEAYNQCFGYARNFLDSLKTGRGLLISGPVGTGKTHLVAAIINYIASVHSDKFTGYLQYTAVTNFLNQLRESYGNKELSTGKIEKRQKESALLVLDDLGVEKETDWSVEKLYEIINYRYDEEMPIIITTNLDILCLKKSIDERLFSRIIEMCDSVELTGKDYRIERRKENGNKKPI